MLKWRCTLIALAALWPAGGVARAQCLEWLRDNPSPGVDAPVNAFEVFDPPGPGGPELYCVGAFRVAMATLQRVNHIARWDGSGWRPLGLGLGGDSSSTQAWSLTVFDDGSGPALFASGNFTRAGGLPAAGLARWNGQTWSAVDHPFSSVGRIRGLNLGPGAALYAGVRLAAPQQDVAAVARWDGAAWVVLGALTGGSPQFLPGVRDLAVHDWGAGPRLVVGGRFQEVGGVGARNVASFDGIMWSPMGAGLPGSSIVVDYCSDLHEFDIDGAGPGPTRLIAAGGFQSLVRAWDGTTWIAFGGGLAGGGSNKFPSADVLETIQIDGVPQLVMSGNFTYAGGQWTGNAPVRWDGATWNTIRHAPSWISALRFHDDGTGPRLFVGRYYADYADGYGYLTAWTGANWDPADALPTAFPSGAVSYDAGLGGGPELIVRGRAATTDPAMRAIFRWTPAGPVALGSGLDHQQAGLNPWASCMVIHDDGLGRDLFVGGDFTSAGGTPALNVARWNGVNWSPVGMLPGPVLCFAVHDDGTGPALYAGGWFGSVARWDGSGWISLGAPSDPGGTIYALESASLGAGPRLFAGGQFNVGSQFIGLQAWDGASWTPFLTGPNSTVSQLVATRGAGATNLWVTGSFTQVGGVAMPAAAVWDGVTWSPPPGDPYLIGPLARFDEGTGHGTELHSAHFSGIRRLRNGQWQIISGAVSGIGTPALSALVQHSANGARRLVLVGNFDRIGDTSVYNIAQWTACPGVGALFCSGDGLNAACPCGNTSAFGSGQGCRSSLGRGAQLTARGVPSIASDTLTLDANGMPQTTTVVVYQGTQHLGAGQVFGDGLACATGVLRRIALLHASAGSAEFPGSASASISALGGALSGATRVYQAVYRDATPFCTNAAFNTSNAIAIEWLP